MTTADQFRSAVKHPTSEVSIAGVPWPAYKVLALVVGLLIAVIVAVATTSAMPVVLGGAAAGTIVWLGLGIFHREH